MTQETPHHNITTPTGLMNLQESSVNHIKRILLNTQYVLNQLPAFTREKRKIPLHENKIIKRTQFKSLILNDSSAEQVPKINVFLSNVETSSG